MSPLDQARDGFTRLLGWTGEDLYPVDFCLASYLSTFLPGQKEKPWGALVGGPGTGKSQVLHMFDLHARTVSVQHFTENSFTSAYQDPNNPNMDFSLLARLSPQSTPLGRKVLIIHEMSTVLQGRPERANKLMSDLRAAFEDTGGYTVSSGMQGLRTYDTGFGLLIASTEVMDDYLKTNQTLGERTIICRTGRSLIPFCKRREVARSAFLVDRTKKAKTIEEIQNFVKDLIDESIERAKTADIGVPENLVEKGSLLTNLVTSIRTCPLKNSYVSTPEGPARLSQQVRLWGDTRALIDGRDTWNLEDYKLVRRLSIDTMPPDHWRLFNAMWRGSPEAAIKAAPASELAYRAKVEPEFAKRQLRQWTILDFMVQCSSDLETYAMKPEVAADAFVALYGEVL